MTNFVIARSRPDEKWRIPVVIDQWFESYRQNKIYIKPIPLGHGWFENFNFNFKGGFYTKEDFCFSISYKRDRKYYVYPLSSMSHIKTIEYVHELQNLYFEITGIELNYKGQSY